jgi:hypothetical protein
MFERVVDGEDIFGRFGSRDRRFVQLFPVGLAASFGGIAATLRRMASAAAAKK